MTKGRRDKQLPLISPLDSLLTMNAALSGKQGLLFLRRDILSGRETAPLVGMLLAELAQEFHRRCTNQNVRSAAERQQVRDKILHDAGGISYDHIMTEFNKVARALDWPRAATLKDFRHLSATCLENAGMPEHYRKFLMGQSPGRAAIVTYTHLNEIRQRFDEAIEKSFGPIVEAIARRTSELGFISQQKCA